MKLSTKLLPLALLLTLALTACTTFRSGHPLNEQAIATFKPGVTTLQKVEAQLGPPSSTTQLTDGSTILFYSYRTTRVSTATYIPIVNMFARGAKTKYQSVEFTFGPDGKLRTITRNQGQQ